jgi:hypothetical protein
MKLPERIDIKVLADGKPAGGMFVCLTLRATRKNDFALGFGPANEEGALRISRDDLLREAEKDRQLFIMDYGNPEEDFAGEILVKPLNREELERAAAVHDKYQQVTRYPARYAEQIREARATLDRLSAGELSVEVRQVIGGARIRAERVRP